MLKTVFHHMRKNGVLLLKVTAVIVAVELTVMSALPSLGLPGGWLANVVDAVLLAAITAPIFYFWIFREMRKKADLQQAHKELDLRLQALLDNELVGIYVIKDGRFIYANQAFAAIFGYARHELLALLLPGPGQRAGPSQCPGTGAPARAGPPPDLALHRPMPALRRI